MWNNLPLSKVCNSFILEIPPPPIILSGQIQLNQTHPFKILQPFEPIQIWAIFANSKYGTMQHYFK
jgi:hypothetical protein